MRSVCVAGVALALFSCPSIAAAQKGGAAATGAPHQPAHSSSQFTLRRDEAGGADAQIGRARARAGDCAGALAAFDAAIRITIDPTLRRDRGLCHEKLSHPYPAIDDYRAYLTARPDAPDSDQIRQRLAQLEEQAGVGGPSSQAVKAEQGESEGKAEASGTVSIGSGGAKASVASSGGGGSKKNEPELTPSQSTEPAGRSYDYYAAQEKKADEAETSPLRHGEGIILGAFLHLPRYFLGEGETKDMGYGVGGALRWSTGPSVSLISEIGYAGVGTAGANSSKGGLLLLGGVELRLPISRYASDQVVLRGGLGYERYTVSQTRLVSHYLLARGGVGFRHIFGPSLGFEILFDGGPAYVMPEVSDNRVVGMVSASAALLVAF
jgi:hypothetical protein